MKFFQDVRIQVIYLTITVIAGGCAYQQPTEVTTQMARADSSIRQAEQSGAEQGALPELQAAKDKFAEAQRALEKKNKEGDALAIRLAQQAQVDAQYAATKAQSKQQQQAAQEVRSSIEAARQEAAPDAK